MRITQQMIVQNSQNILKTSNVDLKSLVGKVIEGQIISIQGGNLATLVSGDMTLTVNIGDLNLKENQTVKLEISEHKDGVLFANLLKSVPSDNQSGKWMVLFDQLGVSDSVENRTIVETMKQSEIPMTKDNFIALKQGMNEIKTLANELMKSDVPNLTAQLDMPLKSVVINLMKLSTQTNPEQFTTQSEMKMPLQNVTQNVVLESSVLTSEKSAQPNTLKLDSGVAEALLTAFEKNPTSGLIMNDKFQKAVVSMLEQADFKQEALVLKNDLPLTLKNLFIAYDVLGGKGTTPRVMDVLNALEKVVLPRDTLTEMIDVIASPKSQKEKLEWISSILSKQLPDSENKENLIKELVVLKESTPFVKSFNEQMMMMQMPIPLNDQIKQVEIYYKRRKQKPNPEDLTLLVALNTHNYGEVRCLIHKGKDDYMLSFSLIDQETKDVFESNREVLEASLSNLLNKNFKVTFGVKVERDQAWFTESQGDIVDTLGFDLKV